MILLTQKGLLYKLIYMAAVVYISTESKVLGRPKLQNLLFYFDCTKNLRGYLC